MIWLSIWPSRWQYTTWKRWPTFSTEIWRLAFHQLDWYGDHKYKFVPYFWSPFLCWSWRAKKIPVVDIACSQAAICGDISFENFNVAPPAGEAPRFICQNTANVTGLTGSFVSSEIPVGSDALQHLAIPLVRHESKLEVYVIAPDAVTFI